MRTWKVRDDNLGLDQAAFATADPSGKFPQEVQDWLGEIYMMKEIPLEYMVADEKLLPMESMRFFRVDQNWLQALTDGATSIGRSTETDATVDSLAIDEICAKSFRSAGRRRQLLMHPNHRRTRENFQGITIDTTVSGFLLRSDLVSHWKGIEVRAYQKKRPCDILRMEVLADKILICLFEGIIDTVQLQEPAEALRFGTKANNRLIRIRAISGTVGENTRKTAVIPSEDNGRVKVRELVKTLASQLDVDTQAITSAELALEMMCIADMCELKEGNG